MSSQIKDYRPEIDGLRALAVLPVIFYHANFSFFKGGYLGLDIFFVISGYLIGKIINKNAFTLKNYKNFLLNRVRRIFPGLLGLIIFTFVFLENFFIALLTECTLPIP